MYFKGCIGFFLSQATAAARLATDALAFERQEAPPPFIQADYWEAPSDTLLTSGADSQSPDGVALPARPVYCKISINSISMPSTPTSANCN